MFYLSGHKGGSRPAQQSNSSGACALFLDAGTCNFNNRYLLAVARENSPAMKRYRGAPVLELQESESQSESAGLSKLSLEQTGSKDKDVVSSVAKAASTEAKVKQPPDE